MSAILNDNQIIFFCNFMNFIHITRLSCKVNGNDCPCLISNFSADVLWAYVIGFVVDISKYWCSPQYKTLFAEAANVNGVVITSSPGLIPAAKHAT